MKEELVDSTAYEISRLTFDVLRKLDTPESFANQINTFVLLALLIVIVYVTQYITKKLLRRTLYRAKQKSGYSLFQYLLNNKFAHYLAVVVPFVIVKNSIEVVFVGHPKWYAIADKFVDAFMVIMVIKIFVSLLISLSDLLKENEAHRQKPLESYLQVIRMILFLFGAVIIFSIFTGKSPLVFFTAMGAMSAVLLLMFKDVIMGFVASIQITTNDMVRIGDWITMSKYGADGNVTEINLTTVKVQNFDKTITTIPTYSLTSDSFQNWRWMQQSGSRRIKRALYIKQPSVKFLDEECIERFSKIQGVKDYLADKTQEINAFNEHIHADKSLLINGRNLTNLGVFRYYAEWYLKQNPAIFQDLPLAARQLAPTDKGIPIEIYVFSNTIHWKDYEEVIANIFDHLLASLKYFDLEVFEI